MSLQTLLSRSREHYVTVERGISIRVIEILPERPTGDYQPTILFIPGWISQFHTWDRLLPLLNRRFRILYTESREKPSAIFPKKWETTFSMSRFATDIMHVADHFGLEEGRFFLAGTSLGANIALQYLLQGKIQPKAAVIMLPNAEFRIPVWGKPFLYLPYWIYPVLKPVIKGYLHLFKSDRGKEKSMLGYIFDGLDKAEPRRLQASARDLVTYKLEGDFNRIDIPCLLIGSVLDRMHQSATVKELAEKIPLSSYREIAASGETHTEKVGRMIVDYFERIIQNGF